VTSTFVLINLRLVRFRRVFLLNNILHRSTRLAPIPLSFTLANKFSRRIVYCLRLDSDFSTRLNACGRRVVPKCQNDHNCLDGLPGYLTQFTTHPFVHQGQFYIEKRLHFWHSCYTQWFRPLK